MNLTQFMLSHLQSSFKKNKQHNRWLTEQADKIILWLVGFSVGAIALAISNPTKLIIVSDKLIPIIIIFSSLVVFFGLLYRTLSYITHVLDNKILLDFDNYVSAYLSPIDVLFPEALKGNETCSDIIRKLKDEFNIDISNNVLIDNINKEIEKEQLINLIKYYNSNLKISENYLEFQINEIKNVFKNQLGYPEKDVVKIFKPAKSNHQYYVAIKITSILALILFLLCIILFAIGFIVFAWIYIFTLNY